MRYIYVRLVGGISILALFAIFNYSFVGPGGPKSKKVYKDTIYRFAKKTEPLIVNKPADEIKIKKEVQPINIEKDYSKIIITSIIKKFSIKKSEQKLYVYFGDTFKVFRISLGANPIGHKNRQGDNKTPEGKYKISLKNPKSRGYKSLKISYPNDADKQNASKMGFSPGGDIYIHGLWWTQQDPLTHWKDNWTRGCIAVNNQEIEEIYNHTNVDTEITILP